jgi:hypothetical protein
MGGGKTHSMIGLGLLARDPELRRRVLGDKDPAPKLGRCRVVGFNGRNTDAAGGIWGSIAEQLGKAVQFARYVSPLLSAPGPEAWKQLLGGDPLVLFLDELPPYLEYAVTVPVGNGDLAVVTTTALGNLFVAVAEMDNVCLVLSDLAGSNFSLGQANLQAAFDRAVKGITSESRRIAVPITPVNPNGDELYHILRKRLFQNVAPQAESERVAAAYRDALREAVRMNLTSTTPESLYTRVIDAYPFHPDLRELVGKFKENEGFQQTRGVIRLMQMVVSDLWKSEKAAAKDLISPYDIDFNVDEIASEIRTINPSLSEAIAHDIAHGGDSEVEQIDLANGNADASEAARVILVASLSSTPGAIHGLREYQLVDCLQRPGRDLSTFKANVLDKLATRAWYLHNSADGRLFFKNQQNLAAKLRSTALSLHAETVDRMLREHLESYFSASLRDCYQVIKVLPPPDEVQVEQEKTTLVIVRPGGQANQLPISAGLAGVVGPATIQESRPLPHRLAGHFPEGARFGAADSRPAKYRRRAQIGEHAGGRSAVAGARCTPRPRRPAIHRRPEGSLRPDCLSVDQFRTASHRHRSRFRRQPERRSHHPQDPRRRAEVHDQDRRRELPHAGGGSPFRFGAEQSRPVVRLQTRRRSQYQLAVAQDFSAR